MEIEIAILLMLALSGIGGIIPFLMVRTHMRGEKEVDQGFRQQMRLLNHVLFTPVIYALVIVTLGDERSFLCRIPFIAQIKDAIDSETRTEGPGGAEFYPAGRGGMERESLGSEDDMDPMTRMFGIEVIASSLGMIPPIIGFSIAIVLLSIEGLL